MSIYIGKRKLWIQTSGTLLKIDLESYAARAEKLSYIYSCKVGDHSRGWLEGSLFDSLLHQGVGEGATPFPGLLHFTLDPYLIMLSVKQGGIKYHFLSLWCDSTWDWTQVSRAIGEHSNRSANVQYIYYALFIKHGYLRVWIYLISPPLAAFYDEF